MLGFKQAFYACFKNPVSQHDWDDTHLINAHDDIHHDDPAFGYRFIASQLLERGIAAAVNSISYASSAQIAQSRKCRAFGDPIACCDLEVGRRHASSRMPTAKKP